MFGGMCPWEICSGGMTGSPSVSGQICSGGMTGSPSVSGQWSVYGRATSDFRCRLALDNERIRGVFATMRYIN